jgi:hypothetical protein
MSHRGTDQIGELSGSHALLRRGPGLIRYILYDLFERLNYLAHVMLPDMYRDDFGLEDLPGFSFWLAWFLKSLVGLVGQDIRRLQRHLLKLAAKQQSHRHLVWVRSTTEIGNWPMLSPSTSARTMRLLSIMAHVAWRREIDPVNPGVLDLRGRWLPA